MYAIGIELNYNLIAFNFAPFVLSVVCLKIGQPNSIVTLMRIYMGLNVYIIRPSRGTTWAMSESMYIYRGK
jgi:hypothetical protein